MIVDLCKVAGYGRKLISTSPHFSLLLASGLLFIAFFFRQQQQMNQVLRQQQEQAFQESLIQDMEKDRRKIEEEKQKKAEIEENLRRKENERNRLENLLKRKDEIRRSLPAEPEASDPDCVRVRLTFPSGAKLERRFKSNDSLQVL